MIPRLIKMFNAGKETKISSGLTISNMWNLVIKDFRAPGMRFEMRQIEISEFCCPLKTVKCRFSTPSHMDTACILFYLYPCPCEITVCQPTVIKTALKYTKL